FLEKIDRQHSPELSRLLNLGSVGDKIFTDAQIQALEDQFEIVVSNLHDYKIYWQLSSYLHLVRLNASDKVNQYADDLLSVLTITGTDIDLNNYPPEFVEYWNQVRYSQDFGVAYGWTEKVSEDERFAVIMAARIFNQLVKQMRDELLQVPPPN
ncbi:MAG TPA: hypothetical protein VHC46_04765, partial [Thermodesulfobacteriota bacterium]|nr:hypothetical protein [Thermodesulfobacteriota bacterium]